MRSTRRDKCVSTWACTIVASRVVRKLRQREMDLGGALHSATPDRGVPRSSACISSPGSPSTCLSISLFACAISQAVCHPCDSACTLRFLPMPGIAAAGLSCRNASSATSCPMMVLPAGLRYSLAIFASSLLGAMPTDTVRCTPVFARSCTAFAQLLPSAGTPPTQCRRSAYHSSTDARSMRGHTSQSSASSSLDATHASSKSDCISIACGASALASRRGMPVFTPSAFAS